MPPRVPAIIDGHHHIWRMADLPWLAGPPVPRIFGAYDAICRDYPVEEFRADLTGTNVVKSVYVQANWLVERAVDEAAWVQSVADRHGFPHGIVAYADLASPTLAQTLEQLAAFPNLRGIRQQLHWHANPQYRFAARPDVMNDPAWRRGLARLPPLGLVFELQVFAPQMADAVRLARDFPEVTFALEHAGMLEDRSPAGWDLWRAGMRSLAACSNVCTKLSGLGTFIHAASVELQRPVVLETLEAFGADRCLYGSNFPIEKLWTGYDTLLETLEHIVAGASADERQAIFHDTAARVYRL